MLLVQVAVEDGVTTFIPSSGFFPANITTADLEFNGPSWIVQIISEVRAQQHSSQICWGLHWVV